MMSPAFDEAPETGATFEENALAKARDAFARADWPSVADDSGLEVDALNGMPGVLSARWSGLHGDDAANTALLLAQLRDVPDSAARGRVCVRVRAGVRGSGETVVRGEWRGWIARESRGAAGSATTRLSARGLGPDCGRTDARREGRGSHRGRALVALLPALRELAD